MMVLTLDTSCFEAGSKELADLMMLCENGKIQIQVSPVTMEEIIKDHPKKIKQYVEYLRLVKKIEENRLEDAKKYDEIARKVMFIHSPRTKNDAMTDKRVIQRIKSDPNEYAKWALKPEHMNAFMDVEIFTQHVMTGADFFVTKDRKGFINDGHSHLNP